MNRGKWVCRYLFFALLLGLCLAFCGYCLYTISQLEAQTQSLAFLDMALESVSRAHSVLDQITRFEGLLKQGLMVTGGVAGCLVLLIAWHVLSAKRAKRPGKPRSAEVKSGDIQSIPVCPHCGAPRRQIGPFCENCGKQIS